MLLLVPRRELAAVTCRQVLFHLFLLFNRIHTFLQDPGFSGSMYTWCNNNHGSTRQWARLDRFLVNSLALSSLPPIKVLHCARHLSDHSPIVLKACVTQSRGNPFRRSSDLEYKGE